MSATSAPIAAALAATVLAGCQGSSTPAAPAVTTVAEPTYDAEERALVRRALRRLEDFEAENRRILAAGRATAEARAFYQDRLRDWEDSFALLRQHDREGVRVVGRPDVLSTRAVSVQVFQDLAADVVLERCVDLTGVRTTRDGTPVPSDLDGPVVQEVVVHRYENRTWWIGSVETTGEACVG